MHFLKNNILKSLYTVKHESDRRDSGASDLVASDSTNTIITIFKQNLQIASIFLDKASFFNKCESAFHLRVLQRQADWTRQLS